MQIYLEAAMEYIRIAECTGPCCAELKANSTKNIAHNSALQTPVKSLLRCKAGWWGRGWGGEGGSREEGTTS